jgi:hypothetical protein
VEKAMAASGASPEDIAKILLIQTALRAKGVPPDVIAAALNKILKDSSDQAGILAAVEAALQNNDLSLDEVNKVLAMSKALDGGKVRGMKDLQKMLDDCTVDSIEGIEALLREVFDSGVLSPAAVEQAMVFQKAIASSGGIRLVPSRPQESGPARWRAPSCCRSAWRRVGWQYTRSPMR